MNVERLVGGQGPRGGGPDHSVALVRRKPGEAKRLRNLLVFKKRKADIDRRVLALLVLDLGFGQRRAAVEAPVDGLQAAIDVALREQLAEHADLVGLVAV